MHAFRVESETARYPIVATPRHEHFHRAIAEPALAHAILPDGRMGLDEAGAVCEAYGVEGVAPAPAGHD